MICQEEMFGTRRRTTRRLSDAPPAVTSRRLLRHPVRLGARGIPGLRTSAGRVAHGGFRTPLRTFLPFVLHSVPTGKPVGSPELKSKPQTIRREAAIRHFGNGWKLRHLPAKISRNATAKKCRSDRFHRKERSRRCAAGRLSTVSRRRAVGMAVSSRCCPRRLADIAQKLPQASLLSVDFPHASEGRPGAPFALFPHIRIMRWALRMSAPPASAYLNWLGCRSKKSVRGGSSRMRWRPSVISPAPHSSALSSKS